MDCLKSSQFDKISFEKGFGRFVEFASEKIQKLEKQVINIKERQAQKLQKLSCLEESQQNMTKQIMQIKEIVKDLRVRDINKYLVYKEEEARKLSDMCRVVDHLEAKYQSADAMIRKMNNTLKMDQQSAVARQNLLEEEMHEYRNHVDSQLKYIIGRQVEHVKNIHPEIQHLAQQCELNTKELSNTKVCLKELSDRYGITLEAHNQLQKQLESLTNVRDHLIAYVDESCANISNKITTPDEDLSSKIDKIGQSITTLKQEFEQMIKSAEDLADERYNETSKSILQLCTILKANAA